MLKLQLASLAAAAALSVGVMGSVQAGPLTLISGDFKFTIDNYDSGTTKYPNGTPVCNSVGSCDSVAGIAPAPGSVGSSNPSADTMGIFSVAQISRISDGSVFWQKGPGEYLTGVFGNLQDHYVDAGSIGSSNVTSTRSVGGTWALWMNTVDYNPALGPLAGDLNALSYPGISGGTPWLSGYFGVGVIAADGATTYTSTYNTDTLAGAGQAYLEVNGGTARAQFDTDSLIDADGHKHDLFMDITFNDADGAASNIGWTVTSSGQIKGNAVPEPGTMALAGLALLGAGLASRRRKA
ncbi:PEP-CTERM sorting domain-containing protein [Oryzisolibacter sp. LB2S]|uniref:PEP-CTERM sorting domain-containing protein n=1 Tax=Alicycliphilus soli TaxID=3228789 RepID=UPI0034584B9F